MPELPDFDPHDFAPGQPIDNPYFPLREGFTYHYVGREFDEATGAFALAPNDLRVPHGTKQVDGVQALVVYDTDDPGSQPSKATRDYYAQDKHGNVWSVGELTTQVVRDRQGKVVKVTHEGSWEAGVNGAKPGLVMKAHPRVGDDYFREHAPGVALDSAAVTTADNALRPSADVPPRPGDQGDERARSGRGRLQVVRPRRRARALAGVRPGPARLDQPLRGRATERQRRRRRARGRAAHPRPAVGISGRRRGR